MAAPAPFLTAAIAHADAVDAADAADVDAPPSPTRLARLQSALLAKDTLIEQLNESAHAFKLLSEKQQAEVNAKELLLARKTERIDELLHVIADRDAALAARQAQLDTLHHDVQELHDQLAQEEQEFGMLRAALDAKDAALAARDDQLAAMGDREKQLAQTADRHQVVIRRLEKQIDQLTPPDCADACLSPRSFHENQLIALRDDAIHAKTSEVWLLSGQNDRLRAQLDELEAELQRAHGALVAKETEMPKRQKRVEKLEADVDALRVVGQQAQGREQAIEIATTQNTRLLQALQAQEQACDDLQQRAQAAEAQLAQLKQHQRDALAHAAQTDVEVACKTREAQDRASAVALLQDKLARDRKALQQELNDARTAFAVEVDKLQSELAMRRNKQYELTLQLQQADGQLHDARDQLETATEQLLATKGRMEELERVLHESLEWKRRLEHELEATKQALAHATQQHQTAVRASDQETSVLKRQLQELKDGVRKTLYQDKK